MGFSSAAHGVSRTSLHGAMPVFTRLRAKFSFIASAVGRPISASSAFGTSRSFARWTRQAARKAEAPERRFPFDFVT
jgi:hypothetical protein